VAVKQTDFLTLTMEIFMILFQKKRQGATLAGVFSVAFGSVLLLCGAGPTPTGNVQNADVNANSFSLTNAATVSAANFVGSGAGLTNVPAAPWQLKSANFTAVAGGRYQVDTSGGAVTVTLPASATAMDSIELADAKLSWNSNNVTINRNGLNINNGTSNYTALVQGNKLSLVYISPGYGWSIK
jgi:hypothetical protein